MRSMLKAVWVCVLVLWTLAWTMLALLLVSDYPASVKLPQFENIAIIILAPWIASLVALLVVRKLRRRDSLRELSELRSAEAKLRAIPPVNAESRAHIGAHRKAG